MSCQPIQRRILAALLICAIGLAVEGAAFSGELDADASEQTQADIERAQQLHDSGNRYWILKTVGSIALLTFWIGSGLSARLRDSLLRRTGQGLRVVIIYWLLFVGLCSFFWLVYAFFAGHLRLHAFGLSKQSFGRWLSQAGKEIALLAVVGASVIWIPYWLHRKYRRTWWLLTGIGLAALVVITTLVTPIWIDPLFFDFVQLEDRELEEKLLRIAARCGIEADRIYQINVSADSRAVNAYVNGIFGTARIVIWDTTLRGLRHDQIEFIMAHEMGHYVLGHVYTAVMWACLAAVVATGLAVAICSQIIKKLGKRLKIRGTDDVAAMPLFMLIALLMWLVSTPITLMVSRHTEHEADVFGLEVTQDNAVAESTFLRMRKINLSVARHGWFYKLFRSTHPSSGERLAFVRSYRPWEKDQPLRFGKYIDP